MELRLRACGAVLACACLFGCRSGGPVPEEPPAQQALVQSSRSYRLGREPDQERERSFQELLDSAHASALVSRAAFPGAAFSYTVSPKGAVYPFSEVEVACLVKKAEYSRGRALCREFFRAVDAGLSGVTVR